jgi:hypothetical protein
VSETIAPFSRSMACNGVLHAVARERVEDRLLPDTRRYYSEFKECPDCRRVFWDGSHRRVYSMMNTAKGSSSRNRIKWLARIRRRASMSVVEQLPTCSHDFRGMTFHEASQVEVRVFRHDRIALIPRDIADRGIVRTCQAEVTHVCRTRKRVGQHRREARRQVLVEQEFHAESW